LGPGVLRYEMNCMDLSSFNIEDKVIEAGSGKALQNSHRPMSASLSDGGWSPTLKELRAFWSLRGNAGESLLSPQTVGDMELNLAYFV
jgi:hypothetical protein